MAIAALLLLLIVSTRYSLAMAFLTNAPATALALAPQDARILAAAALSAQSPRASTGDRATARRQARAALLREPGNVSAAGTLGMIAAIEGQEALARGFFRYSALRSRRDLRTQLWLIEDAVSKGNIPAALQHYDIALRTSKRAPDILFPVLTDAVRDSRIREGLVSIFRANPLWKDAFEVYLARQTRDFADATSLFARLAGIGAPPAKTSENILLSNMVTAGDVDGAWRYYRLRYPRSGEAHPRNATFSPQGTDGSPFDWALINDDGISASLGSDASGGALSFAATPGIAGTVTQQLQRLPVGSYQLSGRSRAIRPEVKDYVVWEVACSDGRILGRAAVMPSETTAASFGTGFTVPATNCASQLLRLVVLPSDDIEGVSGETLDIRLDRRFSR